MDRNPEELQYLGAIGILRESYKILHSCFKVLGLLTLTLILPLCFVIQGNGLLTEPLINKIAMDKFVLHVEPHQIYVEGGKLFLIELSYVAFVLAFSLLSTSATVYTVACLYTGKELSYATVLSVVPRVWKRLMITFLWFSAYSIVVFVVIFVFSLVFSLAVSFYKLKTGIFVFLLVVMIIAMLAVHVYISMVWQLASVVSVVEDKYGFGAMRKSKDLMKGKRGATLALYICYLIAAVTISQLFYNRVVHGGSHGIGMWERIANGALFVVLQCVLNLMWLLSQTVLYFVCKAYHHESIDKLCLSDHLEGYLGEYMPLKSAIQLEDRYP